MKMRNNNEKIYPSKYDTVYLNGVVWFKISNPRSLLQGDFVVSSKKSCDYILKLLFLKYLSLWNFTGMIVVIFLFQQCC